MAAGPAAQTKASRPEQMPPQTSRKPALIARAECRADMMSLLGSKTTWLSLPERRAPGRRGLMVV